MVEEEEDIIEVTTKENKIVPAKEDKIQEKYILNEVLKVPIGRLQIHPTARKIYNYKLKKKELLLLADTMRIVGQLEPIIINLNNQIISGARRYLCAMNHLGWTHLDAIRIDAEGKEDEMIVFHNQQRKKTYKEIIYEAETILGVLGKNQGQRNDLYQTAGQDRFELAAKIIGEVSGSSLRRLMKVVDFEKESEQNRSYKLVERIIKRELTASKAVNLIVEIIKDRQERESSRNIVINTSNDDYKIYNKSCELMDDIEDGSVQLAFSSPPYYNLRFYNNGKGDKNELGQETNLNDYFNTLGHYFKEVFRVLKNEGSFFLNVGDTYNNGGNFLIPHRLLLHLCDNMGWKFVNEIIWQKSNSLPQDSSRRLKPTCEKIYHLVKDPKNYYYKEFKNWSDADHKIGRGPSDRNLKTEGKDEGNIILKRPYKKFQDFLNEQNIKGVISGTNAGYRQLEVKKLDPTTDHPALMPSYLPVIPILTCSKIGDIVLDPFSGSGTTGGAALLLGRKYRGYEINKSYANQSELYLSEIVKEVSKEEINLINENI
jgi:DNA modification methylase